MLNGLLVESEDVVKVHLTMEMRKVRPVRKERVISSREIEQEEVLTEIVRDIYKKIKEGEDR